LFTCLKILWIDNQILDGIIQQIILYNSAAS